MALLNRARMSVTGSPGTGTVTLNAAVSPFQSFSGAGAVDGSSYSYVIEEGTKFECGHGTYTASGTTLSRDTVFDSSAGAGAHETFTSAAVVSSVGLAKDAVTAGRQQFFIPAAAMQPRTTLGAGRLLLESATNKVNLIGLDFDPSTAWFAQFGFKMPKQWDLGTVSFVPVWRHGSTTTNFGVVWSLQAVCLRDALALDQAFGTAQTSTDTGGTTDTMYFGPESSAITIAGTPQAEDWVQFQLSRAATNGSDTLAVNATLLGIALYIKTAAENDT